MFKLLFIDGELTFARKPDRFTSLAVFYKKAALINFVKFTGK